MSTSTPKNDNNGKNGRDEYEEITLFTSEFETQEERAAEKSAGTPKEEKTAAEEGYAATAGDVSPTDIPAKPEDTARDRARGDRTGDRAGRCRAGDFRRYRRGGRTPVRAGL